VESTEILKRKSTATAKTSSRKISIESDISIDIDRDSWIMADNVRHFFEVEVRVDLPDPLPAHGGFAQNWLFLLRATNGRWRLLSGESVMTRDLFNGRVVARHQGKVIAQFGNRIGRALPELKREIYSYFTHHAGEPMATRGSFLWKRPLSV